MGFFSVLTLIFIVLQLCGIIAWSWWLVMLPMIIGAALWVVSICLAAFVVTKIERKLGDNK